MASVQLTSGLLVGKTLHVWDAAALVDAAESNHGKIEDVSFYRGELQRKTFRGIAFGNCNFAKSKFERITFRKEQPQHQRQRRRTRVSDPHGQHQQQELLLG